MGTMWKYNNYCFIWSLFRFVGCFYLGADSPCQEPILTFIEVPNFENITFNSSVKFTGHMSDRSACAATCGSFTACLSFVYNNMLQSCTTYSEIFDTAAAGSEEAGAHYYRNPTVDPIDGSWSSWTSVTSPCSVTCGGGYYTNTTERSCTEPSPAYGGATCIGNDTHLTNGSCNEDPCPGCPSNYTYDASVNLCFRIDQSLEKKDHAIAICQAEGGHLVKVDSQAKQERLVVALQAAYDPQKKNRYYIQGRNDTDVWIFDDDRTAITEFFWGNSSKTDSRAIFMSVNESYQWTSSFGYNKRNFICEIKV